MYLPFQSLSSGSRYSNQRIPTITSLVYRGSKKNDKFFSCVQLSDNSPPPSAKALRNSCLLLLQIWLVVHLPCSSPPFPAPHIAKRTCRRILPFCDRSSAFFSSITALLQRTSGSCFWVYRASSFLVSPCPKADGGISARHRTEFLFLRARQSRFCSAARYSRL